MRDPQRIARTLDKLRAHWQANPDQRLGQLLFNLLGLPTAGNIFSLEDSAWEALLEHELSKDGVIF
jgi:hypothetical protein